MQENRDHKMRIRLLKFVKALREEESHACTTVQRDNNYYMLNNLVSEASDALLDELAEEAGADKDE